MIKSTKIKDKQNKNKIYHKKEEMKTSKNIITGRRKIK